MRYEQTEYGLETIVRVNKTKARGLYDAGKSIVVYMVHDNPESPFNHGFTVRKDMYLHTDRAFDAWVNEFEYYNHGCGRGTYAKFFAYVNEED